MMARIRWAFLLSSNFLVYGALAETVINTFSRLEGESAGLRTQTSELEANYKSRIEGTRNALSQRLRSGLSQASDEPKKALAETRFTLGKVKAIQHEYDNRARSFMEAAIVLKNGRIEKFAETFRSFQSVVIDASTRASSAMTFPVLLSAAKAISESEANEWRDLQEVKISASRLINQLRDTEQIYQAQIEPYKDFVKQHELALDLTGKSIASLTELMALYDLRYTKLQAMSSKVLNSIDVRGNSLLRQAATAETQKQMAKARLVRTSVEFARNLQDRIGKLWGSSEMAGGISLLEPQYERLRTFLDFHADCEGVAEKGDSSWRWMGCRIYGENLDRARRYVDTGIPDMLRTRLIFFQMISDPMLSPLITQLSRQVEAGDTAAAVKTHDLILKLRAGNQS